MGAGLFVTFEGIDGAGKSTQLRRLAEELRAEGREVVETREPGGSDGAEAIRRLLLEGATERWQPMSELLLFTAARAEHVARTIRPALAAGRVVLCDRYVDSTRAYQGDQGEAIEALHAMAVGLDPDATLLFDLDPGEAAARRTGREADRIEARGLDFQCLLRRRFLDLAGAWPGRFRTIDAGADADSVAARVRTALDPWLGPAPASR